MDTEIKLKYFHQAVKTFRSLLCKEDLQSMECEFAELKKKCKNDKLINEIENTLQSIKT